MSYRILKVMTHHTSGTGTRQSDLLRIDLADPVLGATKTQMVWVLLNTYIGVKIWSWSLFLLFGTAST